MEFLFRDPKDLNPFLLVAQVTQIWVKEHVFVGAAVKIMAWLSFGEMILFISCIVNVNY